MIDKAADSVLKTQLSQELEAVYQWMENLSLTDIPLHYLIAHPKLLPPESLRFFYLDECWWYALFDGAASLGIHSSIDEALYQVMRKRFLERWIEKNIKGKRHQWGFILRSDLVRMMSGVEFYGFEGGANIWIPTGSENDNRDLCGRGVIVRDELLLQRHSLTR